MNQLMGQLKNAIARRMRIDARPPYGRLAPLRTARHAYCNCNALLLLSCSELCFYLGHWIVIDVSLAK